MPFGAMRLSPGVSETDFAFTGQRIAMRDSSGLQFLLTDHLGSVSAVLDSSGDLLSEQRYLPFGGMRLDPGVAETDFAFTGQRSLDAARLTDYNARWYSSLMGRFTQADSIIPSVTTPQSFNHYSYVVNNPLLFIDTTGNKFALPYSTSGPWGDPPDPPTPQPPPPPPDDSGDVADELKSPSSTPVPPSPSTLGGQDYTSYGDVDISTLVPCNLNQAWLCVNPNDTTGYYVLSKYTGSKLIWVDVLTNVAAVSGTAISLHTGHPLPMFIGVGSDAAWDSITAFFDPAVAAQLHFEGQTGFSDFDPSLIYSSALFELSLNLEAYATQRELIIKGPSPIPVPPPPPQ